MAYFDVWERTAPERLSLPVHTLKIGYWVREGKISEQAQLQDFHKEKPG